MNTGLNNLAITTTNAAMLHTIGGLYDTLQSLYANGGRDNHCHFYHNNGAGGSILQVVAKRIAHGSVSALTDMAINEFNSRYNKKKEEKKKQGTTWVQEAQQNQEKEQNKYGHIKVRDVLGEKAPDEAIYALDDWGCISTDAIMLAIATDSDVVTSQSFPVYGNQFHLLDDDSDKHTKPGRYERTIEAPILVWYDTTALININSDKNVVITNVTGRDYSRKELVSNGDIKFSVSGQITSGRPDVYPAEEIQKFIKIMRYKGIVKVNNQVLDQFGIENILITDFNISAKEGYKSMQSYTFSAIGLQPQSEVEVAQDTITIIPQESVYTQKEKTLDWASMLNNQLGGLKSMGTDMVKQGVAVSTGMIKQLIDNI